jgi:hypothetical protein
LTDAWNLILSGRYDEAARQLARDIDAGVDVELRYFANKAIAELAAGRVSEAERTLSQSLLHEYDYGSNLQLMLSGVQWLNGHAEEAVSSLQSRIQGLKDRSVIYTDPAGGGREGLILYYYGVRLDRASLIDSAHQWLKRLHKRKRFQFKAWPGPLVRWFFGDLDDAALLMKECGTSSLEDALTTARSGTRTRNPLIEFCFHRGVRALREGDRSYSQRLFESAVSTENPLTNFVWYLARWEADLARSSN